MWNFIRMAQSSRPATDRSGQRAGASEVSPEPEEAAPRLDPPPSLLAAQPWSVSIWSADCDFEPPGSATQSFFSGPRAAAVDGNGRVLEVEPPPVLSFACPSPAVRVFSHIFPESADWLSSPAGGAVTPRKPSSTRAGRPCQPASRTRIKPPRDLVKWTDRLYYLLQPPLESLFAGQALDFPFQPFQHQMEGVAFLFPRQAAILADEMGLGKTMQAITAVRLLLHAGQIKNVLLICPKPLVTNWQREFATWAPEIPLGIVEGSTSKRTYLWQQEATPVKIANYELLMRDQSEVLGEGRHFDLVILDEAQRIKNSNSTTAKTVRQIARQKSWALTGTPIENSVNDLHGIFEFLLPGYLPQGLSIDAMAREVGDYVLRRTKDLVLKDMPPRLYRDALLELTPAQVETYREAEEKGVLRLSDMGPELTIQHVFQLVLRLKQICNFDPVTGASSKLQRLEADMEEVAASGQKAIVFSQWVKTVDQMRPHLERFGPLEYHGRIPSKNRDAILKQFKEDPSKHVLLMSYGAGSVGLNLQFCRYVFLFDRWWNPAIEDQAINRAHRIGAAGSVTITRMTSEGTIEERIHDILEEKRQLFETLFSATHGPRNLSLTRDEIFGLFQIRAGGKRLAA
jgi:SNF2 family DNA or RNA helicase